MGGALTWVLPNPSGLNAHYGLSELAQLFRDLRLTLDQQVSSQQVGRVYVDAPTHLQGHLA